MSSKSPLVFEVALAELLHMELRRQAVSHSSERAGAIVQRVVVDRQGDNTKSQNTVRLNLGGQNLSDKEFIALAETLLKLASASMLKSHGVHCWILAVNDNALTDKSVAHLSLLVSRCAPPLVSIDVRGNALTPSGIQRVEKAQAMSPSPDNLVLTSFAAAATTVKKNICAESCSKASAVSQGMATRRELDMDALRRRCCTLFSTSSRRSDALGESRTTSVATVLAAKSMERDLNGANGGKIVVNTTAGDTVKLKDSQRTKALMALAGQCAATPTAAVVRPQENCEERASRRKVTEESMVSNEVSSQPDGEDFLDVTANLNPLLKSVLDLSNMLPSGRLQTVYGTKNIWDVIKAHDEMSSLPNGRPDKINLDILKKLSLPAMSFETLTVLNIRQNGLTCLEVLPSFLLRLDVSNNELRMLSGLEKCKMLTLLNARNNYLQTMLGLEQNCALSHLFLGHNEISFVEGIAHLFVLETLDLAHNRLKTQASIRPLSLSKGLQHLRLLGNPVMERIRHSFRPLLRNLCPSLVTIDDERLAFSRLADRAQRESCGYLGSPYTLQNENDSLIALKGASDSVMADAINPASYMHLLTRGVVAEESSGYSNAERTARMAKALRAQAQGVATEKTKKQQRNLRQPSGKGDGKLLREELLKRLAQESKKFLESVLEKRLSNLHASLLQKTSPDGSDSSGVSGDMMAEKSPASAGPAASFVLENGGASGLTNSNEFCENNSHAVSSGVTQCQTLSSFDDGGTNNGEPLSPPQQQHLSPYRQAVHRDATLDHEEWERLRERKGLRRLPYGGTPRKLSPREDKRELHYGVLPISPIRRYADDSNVDLSNARQMLHAVNTLTRLTAAGGDGDAICAESRAKTACRDAKPRRTMLLSPSTNSSPIKAYRVSPLPSHRQCKKPVISPFPHSRGTAKTKKSPAVTFFPPPPLTSEPFSDTKERKEFVQSWVMQLHQDVLAVQDALHAIVSLLDAQRRSLSACRADTSFFPTAFIEERNHCVDIIKESGMLLDTEIPFSVAKYYNLSPDELNCVSDYDCIKEESDDGFAWNFSGSDADKLREKSALLRSIRTIGDGKTCLRYIVLLMEKQKERELQQYVDELIEFMASE